MEAVWAEVLLATQVRATLASFVLLKVVLNLRVTGRPAASLPVCWDSAKSMFKFT